MKGKHYFKLKLRQLNYNTIALDSILIEGVSLIASARETPDAVLTSSVFAHVGEIGAFVNIFAIDVTVAFWTEFLESNRSWFRTRITGMTPGFTDTTTADALEIMALKFFGADTVTVFEITRLLALINAPSGRVI